jgi:hypothetical protein
MEPRSIKTFKTRTAARAELATMRGWNAKITKMYRGYHPDDTDEDMQNTDADGNTYVIQCGPDSNPQYMRNNGYVE